MKNHAFFPHAQHRLGWLLVLVSLLLAALAGVSGASSALADSTGAPSVAAKALIDNVVPDGTLIYRISVTNNNTGNAELQRTDVTFHYDPNTLTLLDSKFNNARDFVNNAEPGKATVQFVTIDSGKARSAFLIFHVNPNASIGAPIQSDVAYKWSNSNSSGGGGFVVDEVIVASTAAVPAATIAPGNAASGAQFQVSAQGLGAEEQVVTWLNLPDGTTKDVDVSGETNEDGAITLRYTSADLAPGTYSMVVHGIESELNYVVTFAITAS